MLKTYNLMIHQASQRMGHQGTQILIGMIERWRIFTSQTYGEFPISNAGVLSRVSLLYTFANPYPPFETRHAIKNAVPSDRQMPPKIEAYV